MLTRGVVASEFSVRFWTSPQIFADVAQRRLQRSCKALYHNVSSSLTVSTKNMTKPIKNQDQYPIKDTLEKVLQLRQGILEVFKNTDTARTLEDLPHSMVPTRLLFDIAICYEVMYEKLIEDGLMKTGNHKADRNLH